MSFQSKRELLVQVAPRYREASRKEKGIIPDEFVAATGYRRKYAIRLLGRATIWVPKEIRRPRSLRHGTP